MSYKIKSYDDRRPWGADNGDIKQYFGLKPYSKLPKGELGPVVVPLMDGRTTLLWLKAFVPGAEYRGKVWKTSKHRTFTSCPDCGAVVPAGRTHQHKCKIKLVEALSAIEAFKPKTVQGLYNYSHYERADGAWFQLSIDRTRQEVIYCAGSGSKFQRFDNLKEFGRFLTNEGNK